MTALYIISFILLDVATVALLKLTPEQMVSEERNQRDLGPVVTEGNTPTLDVPTIIRTTNEFDWIWKNWGLKGDSNKN